MLVQLHWQNRQNLNQTEFVAQTEFTDADQYHLWLQDHLARRGVECPKGWMSVVFNQYSKYFAWQTDEPATVELPGRSPVLLERSKP